MTALSAWADSRTLRHLGSTTDKAARLAIALGSVRSVIRVIDRNVPALSVDWASVDDTKAGPVRSMSYTDMRGGRIAINPTPILDGRLDHGAALDVCVGFGMHEASHSQESRSRYEALLKREPVPAPTIDSAIEAIVEDKRLKRDETTIFDRETGRPTREVPAFEPMAIAAYLWNVVEDVRIEGVTGRRWPGFVPYFDCVLAYMWDELREHHELPTAYGPTLADKLRVVFLACRYPAQAALLDASLQTEIGWWQAWQHDYLIETVDTAGTIRAALDHLAEDPATEAELEEMAYQERKERARGEKIRAQLERLIRAGLPGTYGVCITEEGEVVPLDAETSVEVDRLVRENLVEHQTIVRAKGARNPPIRVRRPEETTASKRAYIGRPDAESAALRTALVFRNSAPQHDLKLLKSGTLDDEELYRWGMGDHRVFSERVIEAKPDVFMALLVDISGSMSSWGYGESKLKIAQRLAQVFVWALHDQEGVETAVYAHTGDLDEANASEVFRIWSKGDPLSRLGLISTLEHSDNYDSHALSFVVKDIMDRPEPNKQVVILSDGLPAGQSYGGDPAMNHVRQVVKWAESRGVTCWQLAIDPHDLRPQDQEQMYGNNWIGYRDAASLPRQLSRLMGRWV